MNRRQFLRTALMTGSLSALWSFRSLAGSGDQDVRFLRIGDPDYDTYRTGFNSRINRFPAVVAVCKNEAGVQKSIRHAREDGLSVAIKSGGHHFEGYCLNDGGMCVDLTLMNGISPLGRGRVVAEPSVRLIQVYEQLMPLGYLLPTGSCAMVGLSGITLGGGYGLFARQYGLTSDWLRRARVVDGRGDVRETKDGDELMWALRGGGGGGLGVVTELEFETLPPPGSIWSFRFKAFQLSPQKVTEKTRNWFALAAQLPRHAFSAYVLSGTTLTILITSTAHGADVELRSLLDRFGAMTDKSFSGQKRPLPEGVRAYYGKLTPLPFRNASAGFYREFEDIESVIEPIAARVAANPGLLMQINTLGGAIDDPVPALHSVYAHRGYPFLGEIQSYWEDSSRAPALMAAVHEVQALFAKAGVRRHYANYADGELLNWQHAYYGESGYDRLRLIKNRLDPENLFRHPQSIEPDTKKIV